MSEITPTNDDAIVNELLGRLQQVRFDARFTDMLGMAEKAQKSIDALTDHQWSDVNDCMTDLYRVWEATDWDGKPVKVSGKMRPAGMDESIIGTIPDGSTVRHDEKGIYYLVENVTMAALGFSVDSHPDQELSEYHPVVFTFVPVDEYEEGLSSDDGLYMMHPSDIVSIEFPDLSLKGAIDNLKYHFPDIYKQLKHDIKSGASSDRAIVESLKRLEVTCDDAAMHGYDLLESLNLYIYSRIDFDDMGYEIAFDGPIGALTEGDDIAETFPPRQRYGKLVPAHVCGIMMEKTDDGTYRPTLVVALPTTELYGGYEAFLVPAESLMSIRSLRPRTSQLGNIALRKFDELYEIAEYFSGKGEIFVDDEEESNLGEAPKDSLARQERFNKQFVQMTEKIQGDMQKVVAYDEKRGHYRVAIDDDVQRIIHEYDTLLQEVSAEGMTPELYLSVCENMMKSLGKLKTLKLGDAIITSGATVAIDTVGDEQESIALEVGESLRGRFCGFAISEVPDLPMRITAGEAGSTMRDITILIDEVEYTDKDGETHPDVFTAEHVALALSRDGESTIFKVLYESDDE